ncbi:hypothetical protein [Listeria seeligeri]|nr:hypothetical protein [Listeria seeligeri]
MTYMFYPDLFSRNDFASDSSSGFTDFTFTGCLKSWRNCVAF